SAGGRKPPSKSRQSPRKHWQNARFEHESTETPQKTPSHAHRSPKFQRVPRGFRTHCRLLFSKRTGQPAAARSARLVSLSLGEGVNREGNAVVDANLPHEAADVRLDRSFVDAEREGDGAVGLSCTKQVEDL